MALVGGPVQAEDLRVVTLETPPNLKYGLNDTN